MHKSRVEKVGLCATGIYLILLAIVGYVNRSSFKNLRPNEWGDFLAGAFGPLALTWVVLGFFLQSRELKNSVETLRLQTEELKASVEQQRAIAGITASQLELDRRAFEDAAAQSRINRQASIFLSHTATRTSGRKVVFHYKFENIGATASQVQISTVPDFPNFGEKTIFNLKRGESRETNFEFEKTSGENYFQGSARIIFRSFNQSGEVRSQTYSLGNFQPELLEDDYADPKLLKR